MTRAERSKFVRQLSDDMLSAEMETHIKRAARTMEELTALLAIEGTTYPRAGVVLQEVSGHVGRAIALCREGSRRKTAAKFSTEPET